MFRRKGGVIVAEIKYTYTVKPVDCSEDLKKKLEDFVENRMLEFQKDIQNSVFKGLFPMEHKKDRRYELTPMCYVLHSFMKGDAT